MTNKTKALHAILEWLQEHEDIFNDVMNDYDDICGNSVLSDDVRYPMDLFNDLTADFTHAELADRIYYGYNEDASTFDAEHGNNYHEFMPCHNYFGFNAYGNLVSTDIIDYSGYLTIDTIGDICETWEYVNAICDNSDLKSLFIAWEEA